MIRSKAQELNISLLYPPRVPWATEEERQLEMLLQEHSILETAIILERTCASVENKMKNLGITAKNSYFWTEDEKKKLIDLAGKESKENIANVLGKTVGAVTNKMYALGLITVKNTYKDWTPLEEKSLIYLHDKVSLKELADVFGCTEDAVTRKLRQLGIYKMTQWTSDEVSFLEENWGNHSIEYFAQKLSKTSGMISNMAQRLGLGSIMENNFLGIKISEIEELFKVSRQVISISWVALGLKLRFQKISKNKSVAYVRISDLWEFLEAHQNIWDARNLEDNILGKEPDWVKIKRKRDFVSPQKSYAIPTLTKLQLLKTKRLLLNEYNDSLNDHLESEDEQVVNF